MRLMMTGLARFLVAGGLLAASLPAQQSKPLPGSDDCLGCHETGPRVGKRQAGVPPPFNAAALKASPHADLECAACHTELAKKEFPHPEKLAKVDCGTCHPTNRPNTPPVSTGRRRRAATAPRQA